MNEISTTETKTHALGVDIQGLQKSFNGHVVLNGINLTVKPGEIFAIIGPSGSGKSVLLKHIIGLEKPDSGDILFNHRSIQSEGALEKYRLAMVFQSSALLNSLTVGENVGLFLSEHRLKPPSEIRRIVAEKLAVVGLEGLEGRAPSELSGGMKKRVAIARALVIEPQLILYDEPTSELDPLMAVTVGHEILKLRRKTNVTSILVTHDQHLAFGVSDRVAMIHEGKIIFTGEPAQMKNSENPVIQKFLNAKFNS
ncbi:MAG: ATP-binding cassette domain-containing protein [Verrucomicrobia bacterium]|nr:ATP-binding cassette domain-containing protein [Verrucomicrobiota bacterium]MCF7709437.1 ATP-binding cassette domain-containing protein [Verrucomicrobiota bacterium]